MKTKNYETPVCEVQTLLTEQAVLAGSFGSDNAAGAMMKSDKWLEDF